MNLSPLISASFPTSKQNSLYYSDAYEEVHDDLALILGLAVIYNNALRVAKASNQNLLEYHELKYGRGEVNDAKPLDRRMFAINNIIAELVPGFVSERNRIKKMGYPLDTAVEMAKETVFKKFKEELQRISKYDPDFLVRAQLSANVRDSTTLSKMVDDISPQKALRFN